MRAVFKAIWRRYWVRGFVFVVVAPISAVFLVYACINIPYAWGWHGMVEKLKEEGEYREFRDLLPEPIPDEQNFCAIDLLRGFPSFERDAAKRGPMRIDALILSREGKAGDFPKGPAAGPSFGRRRDLQKWADWFRQDGTFPLPSEPADAAHAVATALSKHDALVSELAAGLDRPHAQWTLAWKTRPVTVPLMSLVMPDYASPQAITQTLGLRSVATARAGDSAKAHETLRILLRMDEAMLQEFSLIGVLVAVAQIQIGVHAVWEVCDARAGSAEDFRRLELALSALDLRKSAVQAWRGEMLSNADAIFYMKQRPGDLASLADNLGPSEKGSASFVLHLIPSGFFDANATALLDYQFNYLLKPLRDRGWHASLAAIKELEPKLTETKARPLRNPSQLASHLFLPVEITAVRRLAYVQSLLDQAIIACALERHRLERSSYPDSLAELKLANGGALPLDPTSGEPMRYRKTDDGRYRLWSVGLDGKDDDGQRGLDQQDPGKTKFANSSYRGDWVWDFPAHE